MSLDFSKFKEECEKTLAHFKLELSRLRSGRASTGLIEGLKVDYYGSQVSILQLGMINAPEPRMLTVQVYDPGAVDAIEKAIQQADLGLNPSRDGNLVRISIPSLTEERRRDLIKKLHKMAEDTKVSLRNHRRDQNEELKKKTKNKEISEDDKRRSEDEVQKITDRYISETEAAAQHKEKEMMEV